MAYPLFGGPHKDQRVLIIPPTTDLALVFPLDRESKKFDKGFYSSALTDGRASSEQIERFLKEIEETMKAKLKWLRRLKGYLLFSLISGVTIMIMYTFAVMSAIDDDFSNQNLYSGHHNSVATSHNLRHHAKKHQYDPEEDVETLFYVWFGAFFNALIWATIFKIAKTYSFKNARKGVQELIEKNQPMFINSGLRWNVPLAFPHYIELWKDYKGLNHVQVNNPSLMNYTLAVHNQAQNQGQPTNFVQKYPKLNHVMDQNTYLDFQNNNLGKNLLWNQAPRNENNEYVPPYNNNA